MDQTSHPDILLALYTAHLVTNLLPRRLVESLESGTPRGSWLDLAPRLGSVELNRYLHHFSAREGGS